MPTRLLLLLIFVTGCAARPKPFAPWQPGGSVRAQLAERRAAVLDYLRAYREAEAYAADADGRPLSVFRDDQGRRCPMAELMFRSGHGELVDQLVAADNAERLARIVDGPVAAWMATSGLTRDEINIIQGLPEGPMELYGLAAQERDDGEAAALAAAERHRDVVALRDAMTTRLRGAEEQLRAEFETGVTAALLALPFDLPAEFAAAY